MFEYGTAQHGPYRSFVDDVEQALSQITTGAPL